MTPLLATGGQKAQASAGQAVAHDDSRPRALLALATATLEQSSFHTAAMALCAHLARTLGARRVTLGVRRQADFTIAALSHGDAGMLDANSYAVITAAMQEACDQGATVAVPAPRQNDRLIDAAARRLRQYHQGFVLCTPLS